MQFNVFPTLESIARKPIITAPATISIREACRLISENDVSSVLVEINRDMHVFSVEDMLRLINHGIDTDTPLFNLNLLKIPVVAGSEHLLAGLELLEAEETRYVGVLAEDGALVGVLTYTDIISAIDPSILIQKKTIGDLIARTDPVTFSAEWILDDVLNHLQKSEDSIIVVDAYKPIGIITTKDIFKLISDGRHTFGPLSEYMTAPVITTELTASIHDALIQLQSLKIKRCVVVDPNGHLVGVVTQSELVGATYGTWIDLIKHHTSELKELVTLLETKALGLERISLTDPLTGLGNRRMLEKRLTYEIERIRRYDAPPFSLLLIDIDLFKNINDRHGHLVGDQVLKTVARKLADATRTTDDVIRWGGEEFAILLPHNSMKNTVDFAYRIRSQIENTDFVDGIKVTVSIGVGQFSPIEKENEFFERVDKALYRAKNNGRNCVVIDAPGQTP